jgi:hypothetical protein
MSKCTHILTTSTRVPPHWRARFRSFFRAVQLGQIALIADCVVAAAEPLWYNSLLQSGRGFWDDSGEYPEATWRAWAWAGFRSVQNLLNADGTFRTSTSIRGVKAGSRTATTFDYMVNRVRRSPIGVSLRRPAEPREW